MRRDKAGERAIARTRMARLFQLAEGAALEGRLDLARRYVTLARRLGTKHVVRLARDQRRRVCRQCGAFLVPGRTSRVRARGGKMAQTCLACGAVRRFGYAREQLARRRHGQR